ncbi:MAG: UDP-2,3-diacylglucosamine diphosphatase [Gammaproteobacteria bacterium]|jgi:UDP-2,3-diacylglucosamine hydrolase|nr:UDP-2,3-diacylglucosamine diphosphatase [Gammaproteobacteria bacterium]
MTASLFISDLHLAPERPATVALFLDFLGRQAREAEALYILGDLFDAWIGDDDDEPPYPAIRAALRDLTTSGTRCAILPGNRDFLLGRRFLADTGCELLADPTRIDLYGTPTLLMHGDLLCTDDRAYQRFRRVIRNPIVKRLFLWRGLERRRALAQDYRRRSMAAIAGKSLTIMDVNPDAVLEALRRQGARRLIHGHTHRPGDHALSLDGQPAQRLVLAEWREDQGEALLVSPGGWRRLALGLGNVPGAG